MTHREVRISDIVIPKYLDIFNNKKVKHIILTSGRAGTKSSYAAIKGDYQIASDHNGSVVVLRKHHNKLRKTVYKEMIRGIGRLGIPKKKFIIKKAPMEISYKKTGSTIYFAGSDGIDDTKGIIDEDKPIKLVIIDEATEFFEDGDGEDELANIEATFVRGNKGGFQIIYLYNPPKNPNHAINKWCKKMEDREDCIHIHTDYRDVPVDWLGSDLIELAETMKKTDEKMWRWVWAGESIGIDELIYYMYGNKNRNKIEEGTKYQLIGIGVDYGQQNATTYQAFGLNVDKRKFQGIKEYFYSGRDAGKQKSPSEYASNFIEFTDGLHEDYSCSNFYVFIDPSAAGLAEEIKRKSVRCNYNITLIPADNRVAIGIQRVQKLLAFGILEISPKQANLDEELITYGYDKKSIERGKEVPIKINDHCCDAMRYVAMGMWRHLVHFLPQSERADE